MITPSTSTNRTPVPPSVPAAAQRPASASAPKSDCLSTENGAHLKAALEAEPAVRPDMLARARALAADAGHPPEVMLKMLAQHLLSSRDVSADES